MLVEEFLDDWVSSPPTIYFLLREVSGDPDSTFQDYAKVIGRDPALAIRLLKIVNSAFYGFSSKVESIEHAMSILGFDQLSDLVLATTVIDSFKGIPKNLINMTSFWEHSIACGLISGILIDTLNKTNTGQFGVAGMLHDIGSLVLCRKVPEKVREAFYLCEAKEAPLFEAEREVLGFDHTDVGASLMQSWKLSPRFVEVALHHHSPSRAKSFAWDAAIVHIADIIAHEMKLGASGEKFIPLLDKTTLGTVRLTKEKLLAVRDEVREKFEETVSGFLQVH